MISYEIVEVSPVNQRLRIMYTKEGCVDYSYVEALPPSFTVEMLQEIAEDRVSHAVTFWEHINTASEVEVTENMLFSGTVKDHVYEEAPDYDTATQKLVKTTTETETTITHSYTIQSLTEQEIIDALRSKRTALLRATDMWGIADRGMSDEMRAYRQALRDIPQQEGFPDTIVWPIRPLD